MCEVQPLPTLRVGLRHSEQMRVMPRHTVPGLDPAWPGFEDMPPVFATAMMIGFIEQTCIQALRPYLAPELRSVGTHVDVSHVAATPERMLVRADVELIAVDGRSLTFRVQCFDASGLIGEGTHRRAIIDFEKFWKRVLDKQAKTEITHHE